MEEKKSSTGFIGEHGGLIRVRKPQVAKGKSTQGDTDSKDVFASDAIMSPPYEFRDLIAVYEKNNIARKCITLKAQAVVKNGYTITSSEDKDPDIEKATDFLDNINPEKTIEDVFSEMVIDLETAGSSGIEMARNKATKEIESMFNVPIDTLRVARGKKEEFKTGERFLQQDEMQLDKKIWYNKYYANPEDRTAENGYDPDLNKDKDTNEIMWFKLPNPKNKYYGLAPSITLLKTYLQTLYAQDYNVNEFENGMISKFAIVVKNGKLTNDSIEGMRACMEELISSKQFNAIPVLQATGPKAEVKIEKLSPDIKESSYLGTMKFNREDVYVGFGVPPILLGLVENATLANQTAQEKKFNEDEIRPLQQQTEVRINKLLRKDMGWENLTFKWKTPSFEDEKKKIELDVKQQEKGILSINEVRTRQGLEVTKGGEKPFIQTPFGVVFIDELANASSEEVAEKAMTAMGKTMIDSFLNYRDVLKKRIKEAKIKAGTDDESIDEPYNEEDNEK